MASSYINNLRLAEMATGDASGTWGTVTNTNLTLIADALGYQSKTVASASTDTLTIPDGTETDNEAISLYVKLTGGNQACTITVGPNTVKKLWIIENATSQVITLTQGSGANVILAAGVTKMIYADGAGSGAALTDALVGLEVGTTLYIKNAATGDDSTAQLFLQTAEADIAANDVLGKINFQAPNEGTGTDAILVAAAIQAKSEGDFSSSSNATSLEFMTGASEAAATKMTLTSGGNLTVTGVGTFASLDISGDIDVDGTSNLDIIDVDGAANFAADVTFADGADIITASAGTSNLRIGVNAGNSIESGGNYNTVVGDEAGTAITTGDSNVIVGMVAGDALTTASDNVAIGQGALTADTLGSKTVAIGRQALTTQNFTTATDTHNVAVGYHAGLSVTTGVQNTLIGGQAGDALTTGSYNTAVGYAALSEEDAHGYNTAIGYVALLNQNAGANAYNVAVGASAGQLVTTGTANTLIGGQAGDALTTGYDNVAIGYSALTSDDVGARTVAVGREALLSQNFSTATQSYNVAVGYRAGYSVTTGQANTLIGGAAGDNLTDADYNIAIGVEALSSDTLGSRSLAIGYAALYNQNFTTATASINTAVGYYAGNAITTGTNNTMVGYQTGEKVTDGQYNVGLGDNALPTTTTGDRNISIGRYAGYGMTTANDNVLIGYASGYANGQSNQLTGGGNVFVGGSTNAAAAANTGSVVIGHGLTGKGTNTGFFGAASGNYNAANSSAWNQTSDRRLKKNITDSSIGLAEINQIQVRNFEYKTKDDLSEIEADGLVETDIIDKSGVQVGAIAQELQAVLPKCVNEQSTGVLDLNTDNLIWHLVKAVQELTARVKQLEES
mgnify:CR=1 FL=1